MTVKNDDICKLDDLNKLRSAPKLNKEQSKKLFNELNVLFINQIG